MLPPEVIQGQMSDERADVWAAGVLLFQMLAGFNPFNKGANMWAICDAIVRIPLDSQLLDAVPRGAHGLLKGLLHKEAPRRSTWEQALADPWVRTHYAAEAAEIRRHQEQTYAPANPFGAVGNLLAIAPGQAALPAGQAGQPALEAGQLALEAGQLALPPPGTAAAAEAAEREARIMIYTCVSIYQSIYLPISLSLYIYIYIYVYVYAACVYLSIYLSICLSLSLSISLSIHVYIHMCTYIYIYVEFMYVCMHACMHA